MALNKERKVLLGLLGSAGLILAIDQLFLAAPSGAQAAGAAQPPSPAPLSDAQVEGVPVVMPAGTDSSAINSATNPLTKWNEQLASVHATLGGEAPDPFRPATSPRSNEASLLSPAEFAGGHKLTAVLTSGEIGVAMVNGQAVRVGHEISGYRLVRVDARSAEFVVGDHVVKLELPSQPSSR